MAEELLHFWESIPFIPTTGICLDTVQTRTILTKATSDCGTGSLARTNCGTLTPAGSSVALWMLELLTPDSLALRNQWYLPVLLWW